MIHVKGNEVHIGNATGNELIEEASRAVITVYEAARANIPKDKSDAEIMATILCEIGRNCAHYKATAFESFDTDDVLNKYFGDLFGKKG